MSLPQGANPYFTLSSELLHERPYVKFYKDMVKIREVIKDYSYMKVDDSVGIVALNEKGEVALVGQWRYPVKQYHWEIPAGMAEEGETPLESAKRELQEEAGVSAEEWTLLGSYQMDASKMDQQNCLFLARKLTVGQNAPMKDEKLTTVWLPLKEAIELSEKGDLRDGFTTIGLLRAQAYLQTKEQ
ncbi:MAG: NUDIX hydrolase [Candidatus Gracilibacteria bacterium]